MSWLRKHWKKLAGIACGAGSVALTAVNPVAGLAAAAVCGVAFGHDAATGKQAAETIKRVVK